MNQAKPIRYKGGYLVNFRGPHGRIRRRFAAAHYPDPYKAALSYIIESRAGSSPEPTGRLAQQVKQYLTWAEKIKRKSPKTLRGDSQRLDWFCSFCHERGITSTSQINKVLLRDFHEAILSGWTLDPRSNKARQRDNPAATWEKYRQIISAFCNFAVDRDWLDKNPLSRAKEFIPAKQQETVPEIFTHEELNRIFDYFDSQDGDTPWHGAFFRFLAYTGARMSEALNLTWRRVDFKQGIILFEQTKSKKVRSVPIHDKLRPLLLALPKDTARVFDDGAGGPYYTESTWLRKLYEACDRLQIPRRRLHDFRHTFCANIIMAGESLATMMELSGHSDYKSAKIYIHFYPGHRANAIAKLPF